MDTLSKEQLTDCFKPVFKQHGFKKNKTTWRKTTDDLIYVLNIQGSQWSNEDYYINVAIYIKALGTEINPPEYRCHISSRIDNELRSSHPRSKLDLELSQDGSLVIFVQAFCFVRGDAAYFAHATLDKS